MESFKKDGQYYKFCLYGFLKNQRFFEPFLLLIFLNSKGLSYTQIGILYSLRFALRTIFEIPSGIIADALGRRGTMLFAYSLYMLSFLGYFLAESFILLLIPTCFFALGDAFRTGTHKAMIFEYLTRKGWQDQKVLYYGHTRSWSQSGSALSSLLAAAIVFISKDYNAIFIFSFFPYAIGFILLSSYPSYLEGERNKKRRPITGELLKVFKTTLTAFANLSSLKRSVNVSLFSGYYGALKDYFQILLSATAISYPFLSILKYSAEETEIILIGLVYFMLYFLTTFASRNSGNFRKYFSSDRKYINILLITGLILGVGAGFFLEIKTFIPAIIAFGSILIIENFRRPAGVAIIADTFNSKILASALSVESQISSGIAAVLSLAIGLLSDIFSPGYGILIVSMGMLLIYLFLRITDAK